MKKYSGFTIIELMIALLIASILIGVAVPSLSGFINERSLVADVSRLSSSLAYARSESITKSASVSVCPSKDGETCSAGDWAEGWIIFRDRNGNLTPDLGTKSCSATEDCILRVADGMQVGTVTAEDATAIGFSLQGERLAASTTRMTICHPKAKRKHQLVLAASGAVSATIKEDACP